MREDGNAANYFLTIAFLTGRPDTLFYDLDDCEEEKLPLAIRAFLTEWRRHLGRARPNWCPDLPDDCELPDLFNMLDYSIDQILRRIVPRYERIEQRRRRRRRRNKCRRRKRAAVARGNTSPQTREDSP